MSEGNKIDMATEFYLYITICTYGVFKLDIKSLCWYNISPIFFR